MTIQSNPICYLYLILCTGIHIAIILNSEGKYQLLTAKQGVKRVRVMMFNATFNNISVISWWSVYNGGINQSAWIKPT